MPESMVAGCMRLRFLQEDNVNTFYTKYTGPGS